jgi:hypothetical protein
MPPMIRRRADFVRRARVRRQQLTLPRRRAADSGQSVAVAGAERPAATECGMMDGATASKAALIAVSRRAMTGR